MVIKLRVPIVHVAKNSDDPWSGGFRLAETREEVNRCVDSLLHRAKEMRAAEGGIRRGLARDHQTGITPGSDLDKLHGILKTKRMTSREIVEHVSCVTSSAQVRKMVHDLRLAGVPVVASGKGYTISQSVPQTVAYCKSLAERAKAVEERADALNEAGRIWHPQGPDEVWARDKWVTQSHQY
jgi:hypothetical protein